MMGALELPARKPQCYIEFRISDEQRYQIFLRFFNALKIWSQQRNPLAIENHLTETVPNAATFKAKAYRNEEDWMLTFRPQDLQYLNLPNHRDSILALKRWRDMSRKERRSDISGEPTYQTLAEFADMLRRFQDIDYALVACEQTDKDSAQVLFIAGDGGSVDKSALEEMLLFFGFFSIIDSNC